MVSLYYFLYPMIIACLYFLLLAHVMLMSRDSCVHRQPTNLTNLLFALLFACTLYTLAVFIHYIVHICRIECFRHALSYCFRSDERWNSSPEIFVSPHSFMYSNLVIVVAICCICDCECSPFSCLMDSPKPTQRTQVQSDALDASVDQLTCRE